MNWSPPGGLSGSDIDVREIQFGVHIGNGYVDAGLRSRRLQTFGRKRLEGLAGENRRKECFS
jgi:hypothetical protein